MVLYGKTIIFEYKINIFRSKFTDLEGKTSHNCLTNVGISGHSVRGIGSNCYASKRVKVSFLFEMRNNFWISSLI